MIKPEHFMQRCITLAQLGAGKVSPNPMVGCVIVCEGKIIGEGYHEIYGNAHAEVNAINSVKNKKLISESEIYINLEPCSHHGKTPPCVDLLISYKPKKVFIGSLDPNPLVAGSGVKKLQENGISTEINIISIACKELNKRFFTFHKKKRPYIILKWAQTHDGFIDLKRQNNEPKINWISCPETQTLVHQWRSEEHAILVGKNTVIKDNPSLTVREVIGKNPTRVILDSLLEIDSKSKIFNSQSESLILNSQVNENKLNIDWVKLKDMKVNTIVNALYKKQISSIIIEGGTKTIQSFIDADLWDEARVILGENKFHEGIKAPKLAKVPIHSENFFTDKIYYYSNL